MKALSATSDDTLRKVLGPKYQSLPKYKKAKESHDSHKERHVVMSVPVSLTPGEEGPCC